MPLAASPIHPMDSVPFCVKQEARLRRICDIYVSAALNAVKDTAERVALFQILGQIPSDSLQDMTPEELAGAVQQQKATGLNERALDPRLYEAWQGHGLTVDALVPGEDRRQIVRDWVAIALIVADRRAKRPN